MRLRAKRRSATHIALVSVLVFGAGAQANVQLELVGVDGSSIRGQLVAAAADSITVTAGDERTTLQYEDLMAVEFPAAKRAAAPDDALRLVSLADRGRLWGRIVGLEPSGVQLEVPTLGGRHTFSLASLAGIRMAAKLHEQAEETFQAQLARREPGYDVVVLRKGEQVHAFKGSIDALGSDGGRFTRGGRELPLRSDTLYAVVFGASPGATDRGGMTLEWTTGESMTGRVVKGTPASLEFARPGGDSVTLPWDRIRRIGVRSERVAFLSDLEPASDKHVPYLNVPWPTRRDRSVANGPIRLEGKTYAKGLGVHSASAVSYELGGRYKQFVAVIGIDDAVRPRGSVVFRVLADGKEAYNSGAVTGRDEPAAIDVPIAGAQELSLIVDFAQDGDLGDHADWADARVIK